MLILAGGARQGPAVALLRLTEHCHSVVRSGLTQPMGRYRISQIATQWHSAASDTAAWKNS